MDQVYWNLCFVLPNKKIRFGLVTQEYGMELREWIQRHQRAQGRQGQRLPVTIYDTTSRQELHCEDLLLCVVMGDGYYGDRGEA